MVYMMTLTITIKGKIMGPLLTSIAITTIIIIAILYWVPMV